MDNVNRASGAAKETVGKAVGNESMQAEGQAQNAQARARQTAEHATEQAKAAMKQAGDKIKDFGGEVKQKVGEVFGNQRMANSGRVDQAKASANEAAHSVQKDMHGNLK
ncbi:hypothetical protein IWW38_002871 [Coemansia aciculifera]|uniref:Uncharacterized protein n=1 Tax=Coemansia aciculifera TaxID=417176 RepID=A0ACC1M2A5_9FUNG|nr:hypothetical protein IWW38_002871 [Coemansia aciculifera]